MIFILEVMTSGQHRTICLIPFHSVRVLISKDRSGTSYYRLNILYDLSKFPLLLPLVPSVIQESWRLLCFLEGVCC